MTRTYRLRLDCAEIARSVSAFDSLPTAIWPLHGIGFWKVRAVSVLRGERNLRGWVHEHVDGAGRGAHEQPRVPPHSLDLLHAQNGLACGLGIGALERLTRVVHEVLRHLLAPSSLAGTESVGRSPAWGSASSAGDQQPASIRWTDAPELAEALRELELSAGEAAAAVYAHVGDHR